MVSRKPLMALVWWGFKEHKFSWFDTVEADAKFVYYAVLSFMTRQLMRA